ncbi:MAG TPA: hypothetical protein VFX21_00780 [Acidimicrobiia bacterium]|nr:hypothetical protein [Acidimicrobiia bacterium]
MELGNLASDIVNVALTVAAVMLVLFLMLCALVFVYARKTGRWVRNTVNRQLVNIAPGPGRELVRLRGRIEHSVRGAQAAVQAATDDGADCGDLRLHLSRLEAAAAQLDGQLERIAVAKLRPEMLKAVLAPLRPRVDKIERIATDLAAVAAMSIAGGTEVELDLLHERVGGERHFVEARTDALQQLRTN